MSKVYLVGGSIRDELLGIEPKDKDYVFVSAASTFDLAWQELQSYLEQKSYKILVSNPACWTIRAKRGEGIVDFVLARHEIGLEQGRVPKLELGSIEQDLQRRDFTINAMARSEDGTLIDLFQGQTHLAQQRLVSIIDPAISFHHDPVRMLRALRFHICKGLELDDALRQAIGNPLAWSRLLEIVSLEQIQSELASMFKHDTALALRVFSSLDQAILEQLFQDLWLFPTARRRE